MSAPIALAGPRTPGVFNMLYFGFRPIEFAREHVRRYGLAWQLEGLDGRVVFTAKPEHVRRIFSASPDAFDAFAPHPLACLFGPRAVIMVGGATHRRLRRLMMPPLHGARLRAYGEAMASLAEETLSTLRAGESITLRELTTRYTMSVILRTVFGAEAGAEAGATGLRHVLEAMVDAVTPVTVFSPTALQRDWFPPWRARTEAYARFDAWVADALATRRRRATPGDDVFSLLLEARDEDGAPMSDEEVRDQLLTLLLAGHETTATALANAVQRLLLAPSVYARLRDELGPSALTPEEAQSKPYLGAVLDETLRIDPIVTDVMRIVREPFELDADLVLPRGTQLSVIVEALHKIPALYPEPERFRPERFLERRYAPHEFAPFGGGVRRCLGAAFSDYESRVFLAAFARRVDATLARGAPDPRVRRNITMGPRRGVPVRIEAVRA